MDRRDFFKVSGVAAMGAFLGEPLFDAFEPEIVGDEQVKQFGAMYAMSPMAMEASGNPLLLVNEVVKKLRTELYEYMCKEGYTLALDNKEIREPIKFYLKWPVMDGYPGDRYNSIAAKAYGKVPTPLNMSFMTQRQFDAVFDEAARWVWTQQFPWRR